MQISNEQIQEWVDNPVTEALLSLVREHSKILVSEGGINNYHRGQPYLTQELLASLDGAIGAWMDVEEVLSGDWSLFNEGEEDEYIRNIPEG